VEPQDTTDCVYWKL